LAQQFLSEFDILTLVFQFVHDITLASNMRRCFDHVLMRLFQVLDDDASVLAATLAHRAAALGRVHDVQAIRSDHMAVTGTCHDRAADALVLKGQLKLF